tara:strand:+ start:5474 stop:5851 length:378 start_codon:yes stop_codon:yes gene_type:complete
MVRIYIAIAILLFMGSAAYGAYYYYNDTQERLATLQKNNAKLSTAVESKDLVIDNMKETQKELEAINSQLALDLKDAEGYTDDLRKKLQEHNLTILSLKKPGLIEKRINDGTKNIISELESITAQ